jgi:hypothetical protein
MTRRRVPVEKKTKRVTVKLIPRESGGKVTEPYKIMEGIIKASRDDLRDVSIGMAWRIGWRPDADGILKLGQCRKRGDLDRELDKYDAVILLNEAAYPTMKEEEKQRIILHELTHLAVVTDKDGEYKVNDRGRVILRIRKHDIEDFREVVAKFGWKQDLSAIAKIRIEKADKPLLAAVEEAAEKK